MKTTKKQAEMRDVIIYDNAGETLDRYTVFTPDGNVYGMSETGAGFNQWIGTNKDIEQGEHLGALLPNVPQAIAETIKNRIDQ